MTSCRSATSGGNALCTIAEVGVPSLSAQQVRVLGRRGSEARRRWRNVRFYSRTLMAYAAHPAPGIGQADASTKATTISDSIAPLVPLRFLLPVPPSPLIAASRLLTRAATPPPIVA